jgi:hypothetical protein
MAKTPNIASFLESEPQINKVKKIPFLHFLSRKDFYAFKDQLCCVSFHVYYKYSIKVSILPSPIYSGVLGICINNVCNVYCIHYAVSPY